MRDILNGTVLAVSIGMFIASLSWVIASKKETISYKMAYEAMRMNSEGLARTRFGAIDNSFICKFKN